MLSFTTFSKRFVTYLVLRKRNALKTHSIPITYEDNWTSAITGTRQRFIVVIPYTV